MSRKSLNTLLSNRDVVTKLAQLGITTSRDLLEANKILLIYHLNLSLRDVDEVIQEVSSNLFDQRLTSCREIYSEYLKSQNFMSSSIKSLDDALRGGLPIGRLTEIVGSAGAGKTQFCLGVCVHAIVDHWKKNAFAVVNTADGNAPAYSAGGGVLYYDTENKFDAIRFKKIAINKFPELFDSQFSTDAVHRLEILCSKVTIRKVFTTKELNDDIDSKETKDFIVERGITLIVIDSIAYLFRNESGDEHSKEANLVAPAANLKKIADRMGAVVLITNQISQIDYDSSNNNKYGDTFQQNSSELRPFLGSTWSHCITSRLVMRSGMVNFKPTEEKYIDIAKSPLAPNMILAYKITDAGISCDLNEMLPNQTK